MKNYIKIIIILFAFTSCTSLNGTITSKLNLESVSSIDNLTVVWQNYDDGIEFAGIKIKNPKLKIYALRVDLANTPFKVVVNNAGQADGIIPSIKTSAFAKKYNCIAAINAGPFDKVSSKEGEDRKLVGLFVSNGIPVSPPCAKYGALVFYLDGKVKIVPQSSITNYEKITNAIGGFRIILQDGIITNDALITKARHPRSAAGLNNNIMFLLVIDGRQLSSIGATEAETALILKKLGAQNALNMDGGGSATFVLSKDGAPIVVNKPVHKFASGRERAVASCIGLTR